MIETIRPSCRHQRLGNNPLRFK
uniref:Iso2 n=1 Tax=Arundo donax TaxID=35708 RepID=A0A0A9EXD3_ARUDO